MYAEKETSGEQPTLFGTTALHSSSEGMEADDLLSQAELLAPKLKESIAVAAGKNYVAQELIQSLQLLLQQYPSLYTPAYRVAISNLVASECENYGNLHLSADELAMIWLR